MKKVQIIGNNNIQGNHNIQGNNNIQVSGDFIKTEKVIRKTDIIYNPDEHISDAQAKEIKDRVQKIAQERAAESKQRPSYQTAYVSFYNRFNITRYQLLPKDLYDDAIKWLDKQIAIHRPKLRAIDNEQYKKDYYKPIHTRARQLGIDVYEFAVTALDLKEPITSLKELNDKNLKKLYDKLFSKRIKPK
ncbi:MAG: ORF6C domain-containing protein [Bacteroidales bacterium]|nr:ORF6C domain-containing protein [Bacteroidales bacterium]